MMQPLRECPVCGYWLSHSSTRTMIASTDEVSIYYCNNRCCQLPPYTRYTVTYKNQTEIISSLIILDINGVNYSLSFNVEKNITDVGKMRPFLDTDEDGEYAQYVLDNVCSMNYIVPWHDALSAYNAISRILKIRVFS